MVDCHDKLPSETPIRVRTLPHPKKTVRPTSPPTPLPTRQSARGRVPKIYCTHSVDITLTELK